MGKTNKLLRTMGSVGKLFSIIPDTTELIGKTIENTRPIIEKELDRRHEHKQSLIQLDDVVHLNVSEGQKHLDEKGLKTVGIRATPNAKYQSFSDQQIVSMAPKKGAITKDTLVKLYYIDQEVLEQSQALAKKKQENLHKTQEQLAKLFKKKQKD